MLEQLVVNPLSKPALKLANTLLHPLIKKLKDEAKGAISVFWEKILNSYEEHLNNSYEHYSYFNSIVFLNEQKKLLDYYLPLTLSCPATNETHRIENYPEKLISEKGKILVVDSAGMGKTTLLKFIFIKCIDDCKAIPIFIELRKLSKKIKVINLIAEKLAGLDEKTDKDLMLKLLTNGKFIIFLDGFDEISPSEKIEVIQDINWIIEKAPKNNYIISSRDEPALSSLTQFKRYNINPLAKEEAFELIKKYSNENSEQLISNLERPENQQVHEFLGNPLLISLMCKSFDYLPIIHNKRHIFYHQVFEALFQNHDLRKEGGAFVRQKQSKLGIDRFEHILRCFASYTYQLGKFEYSKPEMNSYIERAKEMANQKNSETSAIINDLIYAVPLMICEGEIFRWSHRSIQEYFCASYICRDAKQKQNLIFKKLREKIDQHINLISICNEIDPIGVEESLNLEVARELVDKYTEIINVTIPNISDIAIKKRASVIVTGPYFYMYSCLGIKLPEIPGEVSIIDKIRDALVPYNIRGWGAGGTGPEYLIRTSNSRYLLRLSEILELPFITRPEISETHSQIPITWDCDFVLKPLDLDPSNSINLPQNFEHINLMLSNDLNFNLFDYDRAVQYINAIETRTNKNQTEGIW